MDPWQIWLPVFAVLLLILGLYLYSEHQRKRRLQDLKRMAGQLGYDFVSDAILDAWSRHDAFYLFQQGSAQPITIVLKGREHGLDVLIFDYTYTTGSGKSKQTWTQTVIGITSDRLNLPDFSLRPESLGRWIATLFGYQDIDFPTDPAFSKAFLVRGPNESPIRELLSAEVRSYLRTEANWNVEGHRNRFLFYQEGKSIEPKDIPKAIEVARELAQGFEQSQER